MKGKKKKKVIKFIEILMIIGIGVSVLFAAMIYRVGWLSKPQKADVALVLGCRVYGDVPSPFLQKRTEEGYRLYKEGYVDYILVSGGKGPGESITEAQAMKKHLVKLGMDESKIIMEDGSRSTMENFQFSKKAMNEKGLKSAVVVSNKFHLKRASLMARKVGIKAYYSGIFAGEYKGREIYGFFREIPALMKYYLMLGR